MKTLNHVFLIIFIGLLVFSCEPIKGPETPVATLPNVTTATPSAVTSTGATLGGNVTNDGNASVTDRGVVYATTQTPTTANTKVAADSGIGAFSSNIAGLTAGTTYYVRAYAINSQGTAYGTQETFTCSVALSLPTVSTTPAASITSSGATLGGNVTADGNAAISEKGVVYATTANPTTSNTKVVVGTGGTGSYSTTVTGLTAGTTYYVRAYATNSAGTGYGSEVNFTTTTYSYTVAVSSNPLLGGTTTGGGSFNSGTSVTVNAVANAGYTFTNWTQNGTVVSSTASYTFSISGNRTLAANFTTSTGDLKVTDADGNIYSTVTIGTQVWFAENLKTTKFKDGTDIPLGPIDNTAWNALSTPGYCWYDFDATVKSTYGALYNWYTVNTAKLCPTGWHVPSDTEWTILTTFLGGESIAGGKLKETGFTHWPSPNTGATNETGFTAVPGGQRYGPATFSNIGHYGNWWTATETLVTNASGRYMYYNSSSVVSYSYGKQGGFSVRCVRD